jgi:hypothetical protein
VRRTRLLAAARGDCYLRTSTDMQIHQGRCFQPWVSDVSFVPETLLTAWVIMTQSSGNSMAVPSAKVSVVRRRRHARNSRCGALTPGEQ